MPEAQQAAATGRATLMGHYAAALRMVNCTDWTDLLACHKEATQPRRRGGETLQAATIRAEQAWRASAALGCRPSPANCFCALFGLLTDTERSIFTGRPPMLSLMRRKMGESDEDATARYRTLLHELLEWARVQTTTAPGTGGSGGGGNWR